MKDQGPPPTRRRWREEHKPLVRHWRHGFFTAFRRDDPVFVVASFLIMSVCAGMWAAALGGKGRFRVSADESGVLLAVLAAVLGVALLAIAVRLLVAPAHAPLSIGGVIFVVCLSAVSMALVVARAEGVLSPSLWLMFASMGACAVVGAATLTLAHFRSPGRARSEGVPREAPAPAPRVEEEASHGEGHARAG